MFRKVVLAVGVLAGTLGWFLPVRAVEMPSIVINELMWMGSSASSADEWIELRNTTGAPIDVSGWALTKLSSGSETPMLIIPSGSIPAGGFFVISNFSAENSRLAATPDLVETDVSLVNSRLQVKLYDAASALVDTADDGVGNPLSGEYVSGATWKSMERNPNGVDGTIAESWHVSIRHDGFDDALKEFGTPGTRNSNRPPVIAVSLVDEARVGDSVQFDASETTDESDALTFMWDFGDGESGSGPTPTHRYTSFGTYTVRLSVSDAEETSISETTITILPIIAASSPVSELQTGEQEEIPKVTEEEKKRLQGKKKDIIVFNELFPDPDGVDRDEEFIELKNIGTVSMNLRGFGIAVGKKKGIFPRDLLLAPNSVAVVFTKELGILLPNTKGATLFLVDASGVVVNGVTYGTARTGKTFSRSAKGDWQWTEPTAGTENVFPKPVPQVAGARTTIQTIEGTVVKKVGRSLLLDTENGERRAVATLGTDVSFRELRTGDRVRLTGELKQTDNGPRLYPRTLDDIELIDDVDGLPLNTRTGIPVAQATERTSPSVSVASNNRSVLQTTILPLALSAAVGFGAWGVRKKMLHSK